MTQILKFFRSAVPSKKPTLSQLELGEISMNTYDGRIYMKKSGSTGESVVSFVSWEELTGSLSTGSNSFGSSLSNTHTFTGSVSITGSLFVNGVTTISNLTGSLFGTASYSTEALTASYALTAQTASYYNTTINNIINVGLPGSNVSFNSIKAAVDSITNASADNTYTVRVHSGVYIEDTITMKSWVTVKGDSSTSTIVSGSNPSASIFIGADQSMIIDMQIQGATAPSASAVYYSSPTTPQTNAIFYVENVRFGTNYTHAKVVGTSGGNCIMQCSNVKYGGYPFTLGFHVTNDGSGIGRMQLRNVTSTNGGVTTTSGLIFAKADQPGCTFIVNGALLTKAVGAAAGTGFWVENGGSLRLTAVNFQRWDKAIYSPNVGSAPSIFGTGLNFENNTKDVDIYHPSATGKIEGTDNFLKVNLSGSIPLYEVGKDPRIINVAKKGGDFTSVSASVAWITDSSATNRYVIKVGPGEFIEKEIDLTNKPYVSIVGSDIQATHLMTSGSDNLFLLGNTSEVSFMTLMGGNVPNKAAIVCSDIDGFALVHKLSIYDFDYGINVTANSLPTSFFAEYVDINGAFSYGTYVSSSNDGIASANLENYYLYPVGSEAVGNFASGQSSSLSVHASLLQGDSTPNSVGIKLENGAVLEGAGLDIQNWDYGMQVPSVGIGPNFRLVGTMIHNSSTYDFSILNDQTRGRFQGVSNHAKINNISPDFYWNFLDDEDGENDITRKISVTFEDGTHTDASTLIFKGSAMGVMDGGIISEVSGTTINVGNGYGYVERANSPSIVTRLDWNNTQITLSPNSVNYIYFTEDTILSASSIKPNSTQNVILGRVVTNDSSVEFIDNSPYNSAHTANLLSNFNREALGPVYSYGSIVTENVIPKKLNVTAGNYYFSENNFSPSGTSSIDLHQYFRSGSGWSRTTSSLVPTDVYNSGSAGTLVPLSASAYTKHTLYGVGDGVDEKYFLVIGQNQYSALVDAESAGLPTPPTYFSRGVVGIASIYVQSGSANITQIEDIRPVIGFKASGVNASSTHSNLLGLGSDDHTQYLLVDGTREMTGNLGLSGNNLYNVTQVSASVVKANALTGSLQGTASYATNAISSSYSTLSQASNTSTSASYSTNATTASYVTLAQTASFVTTAQTASFVLNAISASISNIAQTASYVTTAQTASYIASASNAVSSSYALTSSYALNGGVTSIVAGTNISISPSNGIGSVTVSAVGDAASTFPYTGSAIISGSLEVIGTITGSISNATSSSYAINSTTASYVKNAQTASYVVNSISSSYSSNALSSSYAVNASTASYVVNSQTASFVATASNAISSSYSVSSSQATNSVSASYITTAQTASYVVTAQTASYVLQAVSSSYSLLANTASFATYSPTSSYADNFTVSGTLTAQKLVVQTISSSVEYSSGSNIFGSNLSNTHQFTGSVLVSGSVNVDGSITGSLLGTASNSVSSSYSLSSSYATNSSNALSSNQATTAITASYITTAQTASYVVTAQTASYVLNAVNATTASFVTLAQTASYVQNAQTASFVTTAQTASFVLNSINASTASFVTTAQTASYVVTAQTASYTLNSINAQTASYVTTAQTASYALNAVNANSSTTATTASYVTLAQTASFVTTAQTASYVVTAQTASYVGNVASSSYATSSSIATSASYALNGGVTSIIAGTNVTISPSNGIGNVTINATGTGGSTFPYTGSAIISGSLEVIGTITGVFSGSLENAVSASYATSASYVQTAQTASYVLNAISSSYTSNTTSASYALYSDTTGNAVIAQTASYVVNAITASYVQTTQTASYAFNAVNSINATTASFVTLAQTASFVTTAQTSSYITLAQSASYVLNAVNANSATTAQTASYVVTAQTASFIVSASNAVNALSSSHANTASYAISSFQSVSSSFSTSASYALSSSFSQLSLTASFVTTAQTASFVTLAQTASYVILAQTASYVLQAVSSSYTTTAQTASYALNALTSSFVAIAQTASYILQSISSSYATTASYVLGGSTGTVTSISVVSANGFSGSVANNTTTPAITLSTTVSGLLKGNGTAISAATGGIDYVIINQPSDIYVNGLRVGTGDGSNPSSNTILGKQTLFSITTGGNNTAIGYNSMYSNTEGTANVALGGTSLYANTTGNFNTAIGFNALFENTTGSRNIGIGRDAGSAASGFPSNQISSNSIYIGAYTKSSISGNINEIVIGDSAIGNGSNTVTIGNSSITDNYFTGSIRGNSFIKSGGTSSQFLKADGSVDSSVYLSAYTVTTKTANYTETATSGIKIIIGDTTGGTFTITLPTAVGNTATLIIKKKAGTANLVVDGAGTETIDGGLTATIVRVNESITLISDNTNWFII